MSNITVFVISGDEQIVLKSLHDVFKQTSITNTQPKQIVFNKPKDKFELSSLQKQIVKTYLTNNKVFKFFDLMKYVKQTCNHKPSTAGLTRFLTQQNCEKTQTLINGKFQTFWNVK